MTLDKAIEHAEEVAKEKRYDYQECLAVHDNESAKECAECGKQHEQLAEWLKLLKNITESGDCNGCKVRNCEYRPKPGTLVRYNCPFYKAEREDKE